MSIFTDFFDFCTFFRENIEISADLWYNDFNKVEINELPDGMN